MTSKGLRNWFTGKRLWWVIIVIVLLTVPLWAPNVWFLRIFILALLFAAFALSWNLLAGYTGQVSFGHALFWGGGAYSAGCLNLHLGVPPALGLVMSALLCGLVGFILAYPCLRVRGLYLALMTWTFPLIFLGAVMYFGEIFGRERGLSRYAGLSDSIVVNYFVALLILAVTTFVVLAIINSRTGMIIKGIRDNETLAEAIGFNTARYKLVIFGISSCLAGLAGAHYGYFIKAVTPETISVSTSILVIIMCMVGGIGSIVGPLAGAFAITFLDNYLIYLPEARQIIYGLAVLAIIFLRPQGLLPWSPKFEIPKVKLRGRRHGLA